MFNNLSKNHPTRNQTKIMGKLNLLSKLIDIFEIKNLDSPTQYL